MTFRNEGHCDLCGEYFQSGSIEHRCQACRNLMDKPKEELIKELIESKKKIFDIRMELCRISLYYADRDAALVKIFEKHGDMYA
jgi:hypothetical protein